MKANAQLIATLLTQVIVLLKDEPMLARDVCAAMGWDVKQFAVVIDAAQFRKIADDAVSEALDKRKVDAQAIGDAAAAKAILQAEGKLERIAQAIVTQHVKPSVTQFIRSSEDSLNLIQSQITAAANASIEQVNKNSVRMDEIAATTVKKADDRIAVLQAAIQQRFAADAAPKIGDTAQVPLPSAKT